MSVSDFVTAERKSEQHGFPGFDESDQPRDRISDFGSSSYTIAERSPETIG
jgi:hypothetical protein